MSCRVVVLLGLLPLAGCIAHAPGSGGGQKQIVVTVSPTPQSVAVGATQPFTATLTGTSNQSVAWSLSLSPNSTSTASGAGLGSIDVNGVYTAPATVPDCAVGTQHCEIQVAITATSKANSAFSGQALANVHVVVTIDPATDTIGQGANRLYTASVIGASSSNQGVNWAANCSSCPSGQTGGGFDPLNLGLYVAPGFITGVTTLTDTVTATSQFDQSQSVSATMTVQKTDPLGTPTPSTAKAAEISCPAFSGGLAGATCYQVDVSCDGIAPSSVYLKVNSPTGIPLGTVIFGTGSGGSSLYDDDPNFIANGFNGGETVVQDLLNLGATDAGYTTVQVSFGSPFDSSPSTVNGWLQGPGGVRRLACRYATIADWVYKNIHNSDTSAPMCGTGNSGGSGALGYAVTIYGLAPEFAMIEPTSGPVMTSLHQGCSPCGQYPGQNACTNAAQDMCYSAGGASGGTAAIIDAAYQNQGSTTPTLCTNGVNGDSSNFNRFRSDSIEGNSSSTIPIPIPNPPTNVKVLLGALDATNAVPQGSTWFAGVRPTPPPPNLHCVPDAPHAIPSVPDGAAQIVSDIKTLCKVH